MSSQTVYLITGANRGIGFGLTAALAKRPDTIIYAGARTPSKAIELIKLAKKYDGRVKLVKLTSGDEADNKAAAELIKKEVGKVDVIIANAGISDYYGPVETTPVAQFNSHFAVNTVGPLVLYQSFYELFPASSTSKFIVVSSIVGSITDMLAFQAAAYGTSKAAVDYLTKTIHIESEKTGLTAFPLSPGWVGTDMGNFGAKAHGMEEAPVKLEDSISGILSLVDASTRETHGGKFWDYTGVELTY